MPVDASAETRRSRPFGLLHVHCVDVVLDRGCLRTAETLRLQLGYGAQRQSCAGTIERDGDGAGRTYLHRRGAAFEVKASQHAPRCVTVAVVGEGHPEAVGTLDVAALLESLDNRDAWIPGLKLASKIEESTTLPLELASPFYDPAMRVAVSQTTKAHASKTHFLLELGDAGAQSLVLRLVLRQHVRMLPEDVERLCSTCAVGSSVLLPWGVAAVCVVVRAPCRTPSSAPRSVRICRSSRSRAGSRTPCCSL